MEVTRYQQAGITGFLHAPSRPVCGGLVLSHGAGSNSESPLLRVVAAAFCQSGLMVLRCDLRFRQKRQAGPPMPGGAKDDRDGLRQAISQMQTLTSQPICIGGHSYGGRQSSILLSESEALPIRALLLLSYPLHPPRKPEQQRTEHFPRLHTPALFLHGTRDPFGTPEELTDALTLLPSQTSRELVVVEGAGHELAPEKPATAALCVSEFCRFAGIVA